MAQTEYIHESTRCDGPKTLHTVNHRVLSYDGRPVLVAHCKSDSIFEKDYCEIIGYVQPGGWKTLDGKDASIVEPISEEDISEDLGELTLQAFQAKHGQVRFRKSS